MSGVRNSVSQGKIVRVIFILIYVFLILAKDTNLLTHLGKASEKADGFTIEAFDLKLDVKIDNKVDVTEKITVNWYEYGHHGIYRYVPTWLEYTGKDGKTIKRKSNIFDLRAEKEQFSTSNVNKEKVRIKIGSASYTLPTGRHTYEIKYTYDMGMDPYKGFDEFIFHAFGDFWATTIKNGSVEIKMPKEFDSSKIKFWEGKKREKEISADVSVVEDKDTNTLYAKMDRGLDKSLTVDLELPEGYFIGGSDNYGAMSKLISLIIIMGAVVMLVLWVKYGKDNDKVPETVEFYPPKGMDAGEVGYVYGGQTGKKLTVALIINLASKGYIKIEESEDKKKINIINAYDPNSTKKLAPLTETENLVFRALFDEGETYTNLQTNTVFYKTFDEVGFSLESKLKNVINDASSRIIRNFCIAWSVVSLALCLLSYFAIADLEPRLSYLYNLSFYAEGLTVFLTVIMGRKTPYGEKVTSQVKGFREYLRLVETEQLKAMVNQNPNYFYDIIPYAYVLNLSKEWIKKFEDIPIPDNYMGNYDYRDLTMYDDLYDSVYYPTSTGSGSGGCSSCGGGCSSCGGGCSSCGGGGSW